MNILNKAFLVVFGVAFNSLSCAEDGGGVYRYHDKKILEFLKAQPVNMTGDYAKAISVAVDDFSKTKIVFPMQDYVVTVFDVGDCFFVQINFPVTKMGTGTPTDYCVNKETYELGVIPSQEQIYEALSHSVKKKSE